MRIEAAATGDVETRSYGQAINLALHQEMERDASTFVLGQDVGRMGGVYGITRNLQQAFGSQRVLDTAIVEHAIVGGAVGAALAGARPIAEVQFSDFLMLAGDEVTNKLAKWRFIHGGRLKLPVVVRAPMGATGGAGAEHSQCLEGVFWHTPGLKIVVPSTPDDARGLLKSAVRDDDPVIFFEHRRLYGLRGPVITHPDHTIPLGVAARPREGKDVSLICWSAMVHECLKAAEDLAAEGIDAEVLDLRTLQPLDRAAIAESVEKTGRAVVVSEAVRTAGPAAEIAAHIAEDLFGVLQAPVRRVCGYDTPIPQSAHLEAMWVPAPGDIAEAARQAVRW